MCQQKVGRRFVAVTRVWADVGRGYPKESAHFVSIVQAQVKFESRVKFESSFEKKKFLFLFISLIREEQLTRYCIREDMFLSS